MNSEKDLPKKVSCVEVPGSKSLTQRALIAAALAPGVKDFLIAAHVSAEPGHRLLLKHLGLKPLLDLGMRLGEGTGAALGISLAETSARILAEMATFVDAGVSGRSEAEN